MDQGIRHSSYTHRATRDCWAPEECVWVVCPALGSECGAVSTWTGQTDGRAWRCSPRKQYIVTKVGRAMLGRLIQRLSITPEFCLPPPGPHSFWITSTTSVISSAALMEDLFLWSFSSESQVTEGYCPVHRDFWEGVGTVVSFLVKDNSKQHPEMTRTTSDPLLEMGLHVFTGG